MLEQSHGNIVHVLIYVYKYLHSSMCAVGLNTGAICHNTDNILTYADFFPTSDGFPEIYFFIRKLGHLMNAGT